MSKFCSGCGNELPDEARFCGKCGSFFEEWEGLPYSDGEADRIHFPVKNNKKPIIIGAVVGAVALIVVLILVFSGGGPESAIDNMIAYTEGDVDVLEDLAPEQYWEYYEMEKGKSVDELIEEKRMRLEEHKSNSDYSSVDYEVVDETPLSELKIRKLNEYFVEEYEFEEDSVSEGCTLKYKIFVTVDGERELVETNKHTVLKIDGDWYLVYVSFDGSGVRDVDFAY